MTDRLDEIRKRLAAWENDVYGKGPVFEDIFGPEECRYMLGVIAELQASNALKDKALELRCAQGLLRNDTDAMLAEAVQYWLGKAKEANNAN